MIHSSSLEFNQFQLSPYGGSKVLSGILVGGSKGSTTTTNTTAVGFGVGEFRSILDVSGSAVAAPRRRGLRELV